MKITTLFAVVLLFIASIVDAYAQPEISYRTQASGEWNLASVWQQSADGINWSQATSAPDYLSGSISIENTHTISITSKIVLDQLTIKEGAVLFYSDFGDSISINNGEGTDLIIEGTFYDSGAKSIRWNNSSKWKMGNNGTLIRTRSTSANNWRDGYEGGINNIPATANWIIRKTGTDNPALTGSDMIYPNLIIENTTESIWATGPGSVFSGYLNRPVIKGSFDVGGSGSNSVSFSNHNTNTNPVLVMGDLTIRSSCSVRNSGTGFEIKGNLTVDGSLLYGEKNGRKIILSGSTQSIKGAGSMALHELQVLNGATLTLNKNLAIDSLLIVSGSIITTSITSILTIGIEAGIAFSNSAYVNGPIRYTGLKAFTFPVGKSGQLRPLTMSASASGEVDFTCEYFSSNPQTEFTGAMGQDLHHISSCEYWLLTQNSGSASKNITIGWNNTSCGITNLTDLRIAHYDEFNNVWNSEGNISFTGDSLNGTITSELMDNFSPIALGSSSPLNPLPVVWFDFTGTSKEKEVMLEWRTASELNNDYFSVQRSADGVNFYQIGIMPSAGNSTSIKQYNVTDKEPLLGISFYRVKQVDYNGKVGYSKTISVNRQPDELSIETITAHTTGIEITITGSNTIPAQFQIMDVLGKTFRSENILCENNQKKIFISSSELSSGIYFARLSNAVKTEVKKFVR